eukprot:350383-Chlamydomonas_euryale.AAC.5
MSAATCPDNHRHPSPSPATHVWGRKHRTDPLATQQLVPAHGKGHLTMPWNFAPPELSMFMSDAATSLLSSPTAPRSWPARSVGRCMSALCVTASRSRSTHDMSTCGHGMRAW